MKLCHKQEINNFFQKRISTYDFPMFCENEMNLYPTTHTISPAIPTATCTTATSMKSIPSKYINTTKNDNNNPITNYSTFINVTTFDNSNCPLNRNENNVEQNAQYSFSQLPAAMPQNSQSRVNCDNISGASNRNPLCCKPSSRGKVLNYNDHNISLSKSNYNTNNNNNKNNNNGGNYSISNFNNNQNNRNNIAASNNDSDNNARGNDRSYKSHLKNYHADNDEVIDLTMKVPVSEMYNDDIDYMNNYLRSLPDYNELNNKINQEYQKCEEMYDRLQTINSGLKNNPLAKSNSCQSIPNKRFAQNNQKPNESLQNKISRSTSSSTIPQNFRNENFDLNKHSYIPISKPEINLTSYQPIPKGHGILQKSSSNSAVNRTNAKQYLNNYWSDNIAKTNQQKLGWNYSKIMAGSKEDLRTKVEVPAPNFKLQKNLSLSQLDKRLRQDLSKEELYNLICNENPPKKETSKVEVENARSQPNKFASFLKPLSKSISQTSVQTVLSKPLIKSSSKSNIPGFFRPLCKSSSNTHVFTQNQPLSTTPTETFVQKGLAKSSSSSCVLGINKPQPVTQPFFLRKNESCSTLTSPNIWSSTSIAKTNDMSSAQKQIYRNNELLKNIQASSHSNLSLNKPQTPTRAENFFVTQVVPQPNKVVVNYPPFTKISTIQIPLNGNLPSALGDPIPGSSNDSNKQSSEAQRQLGGYKAKTYTKTDHSMKAKQSQPQQQLNPVTTSNNQKDKHEAVMQIDFNDNINYTQHYAMQQPLKNPTNLISDGKKCTPNNHLDRLNQQNFDKHEPIRPTTTNTGFDFVDDLMAMQQKGVYTATNNNANNGTIQIDAQTVRSALVKNASSSQHDEMKKTDSIATSVPYMNQSKNSVGNTSRSNNSSVNALATSSSSNKIAELSRRNNRSHENYNAAKLATSSNSCNDMQHNYQKQQQRHQQTQHQLLQQTIKHSISGTQLDENSKLLATGGSWLESDLNNYGQLILDSPLSCTISTTEVASLYFCYVFRVVGFLIIADRNSKTTFFDLCLQFFLLAYTIRYVVFLFNFFIFDTYRAIDFLKKKHFVLCRHVVYANFVLIHLHNTFL